MYLDGMCFNFKFLHGVAFWKSRILIVKFQPDWFKEEVYILQGIGVA
jgi:hypothetical protein